MSGQDLYEAREEAIKSLKQSMERFAENGRLYAKRNREYRIALRQEILTLKAEGFPVTIIPKLAKGEASVAQAEFDMIVAENAYKASGENINVQKLILRSLEEEISREWKS